VAARSAQQRHTTLGRYELLLELGRGGMAELMLARLPGVAGFSKLVAIKRILPHLAEDKQFVDLFVNESKIAAQLGHPNVCQVFELGAVDGELFLVLEFLDGVAWGELCRRLPFGDTTRLRVTAGVLAQIAEGLHFAHNLVDHDGVPTPVIHRDVSPHNLFVTSDGTCKVLDFGVAKIMKEGPRTRTGLLKGKLPYMSPEQIRGEPLDARADVFSLAIVCWESLTGDALFDRDTDFLIYQAISEEPIPLATSRRPELPAAVDHVLAKALARDREYRYASTRELAAALAEAAGTPSTPREIAKALRDACGDKLDERARAIAAATRARPPSASDTVRDRPEIDAPSKDAAETTSMLMRRDSVVVKRSRRPLAIVLALAAFATMAVVAGIAIGRMTGPSSSTAATTEDAPSDRVATPAPPPIRVDPASPDPGNAKLDRAVAAISKLEDLRDHADELREGIARSVEPLRRAPHPAATTTTTPAPTTTRPAAATAQGTGSLTAASDPYATIFVDGAKLDVTPFFRHDVPAGHHHVRAVLDDGRSKSFDVDIKPGEEMNLGKLSW